jgi:small subunit ribosomal protein S17
MEKKMRGKSKDGARDIGIAAKPPKQSCQDPKCPWHGKLPIRGQIIEGRVVSTKAQRTATIEKEYFQFIPKYERYERRHTRIVAYKPDCIDANVGDIARIAECRPLGKTKSFVVIEVL